jgi:predicted NAD/FAD-binding protein
MSLFYFSLGTIAILFIYLRVLLLSSPMFRPDSTTTFHQWVSRTTPKGILSRWLCLDLFWREFAREALLPMFSAVCTATEEDVHAHPVAEFLGSYFNIHIRSSSTHAPKDYIWVTLGSHHYVVQHGVRDVASRLARSVPHIHLSSTIVSILADPSDSSKLCIHTTEGTYSGFSHLIIATQANNGVPLLTSYYSSLPDDTSEHRQTLEELIQCLKSFQYRKTVVVNHTDESFLPPDQRDRRDLNLVQGIKQESDEKQFDPFTVPMSYTMATHVLSNMEEGPIYQTTNPIVPPRQDSVLSVAILERAVLTAESKAALRLLSQREEGKWPFTTYSTSLGRLQGAGRLQCAAKPGIWICGSYAHSGIPLLEGCVASARNIVEQGILRCEGVAVHDEPW